MERSAESVFRDASRGDRVALETLLARHLPDLTAFVRLRTGRHITAQESNSDVVQSVCREVLQDAGDFEYRGDAAFKRWLFLTTLRKIKDRSKYYGRQMRTPDREDSGDGEQAHSETPSRIAAHGEELDRLTRAFAELPEDYRSVISMARYLEMTHAEIAAELGRTEGAVRILLHRAIARLGVLMDEQRTG